jgi:hypothetical protein
MFQVLYRKTISPSALLYGHKDEEKYAHQVHLNQLPPLQTPIAKHCKVPEHAEREKTRDVLAGWGKPRKPPYQRPAGRILLF